MKNENEAPKNQKESNLKLTEKVCKMTETEKLIDKWEKKKGDLEKARIQLKANLDATSGAIQLLNENIEELKNLL